jgi:hypothetical protein
LAESLGELVLELEQIPSIAIVTSDADMDIEWEFILQWEDFVMLLTLPLYSLPHLSHTMNKTVFWRGP